ncbi:cytochrome c [Alsobacter sp. SYSU M60028]|uniref:Cytochrome c n=1 Tax=Alsobacter ponti TaxID=2962936 RepID=A0ABT1LL47_9HYPH|nr:cytochrome c [Alsobacter ponti]MCP8940968.1 cytochrome c [Alsobacter ponti]
MLRALLVVIAVVVVAVGGAFAYAMRHGAIAPLAAPPAPASFDAKLVEKGELLASMGYCGVCHTRAGGPNLAGGLALPTPFGVIHSTNITPDPETGIGNWSEEAFSRAMHQGVDREGHYLYPAFPYDHFTRVTDDDIKALYAWLMTQKPVKYVAPENGLKFPFNIRLLVAGWNLLFFKEGRFQPDPAKDAAWNRGAYLVEGLGHCGSCHSPRNALGGVDAARPFGGGDIEGWSGTALNASSPAPVPWTESTLVDYFVDGREKHHGIAAGPMTPVVDRLADQSDEDLAAIAKYIASVQGRQDVKPDDIVKRAEELQLTNTPGAPPPNVDASLQAGRQLFMQSCVNCHRKGEKAVPLALATTLNGPDPRNAIHIIQTGLRPPKASRDYTMPSFGWMSDQDMANVLAFMRGYFTQKGPWTNLDTAIREVRGAPKH